VEEAEEIIQKAANTNKVKIPNKVFETLEESKPQEKITAVFRARTLLARTIVIFFNW
jgi:hypothetical protein